MALSTTQRGVIGQSEAAKVVVWGSGGEVEVAWPWTDDAQRDIEGHLRRGFSAPIALQVKTSWRFFYHRQSQVIQIPFTIAKDAVIDDPRFYYFFGCMDATTMTLRNPVFLIPSAEVHAHAVPRLVGRRWRFTFQTSLMPAAKDRWTPYRVDPLLVGKHILTLMHRLDKENDRSVRLGLRQPPADSLLMIKKKAA